MLEFQKKPIAGLDLVRFFAASIVMFYHLGVTTWAAKESLSYQIVAGRVAFPELFKFAWSGFIGVEIFFVISGFIITYSAANSTPGQFVRSRVSRLYPAVWLCASLTLVSLLSSNYVNVPNLGRSFIGSLILFPHAPWIDSTYWTLGIEMSFYGLIWALLATGQFYRINIFCYVVGTISAAYWLIGSLFWPNFLDAHLWSRWIELTLVSYGIYFALGILLYIISTSKPSAKHVIFAVFLVAASIVEIYYKARYNNTGFNSTEPYIVPILLFISSVTLIYMSIRFNLSVKTAKKIRTLGLATYPLYLIHDNVGAILIRLSCDSGLNRFAALMLAVSVCVATSIFIAAILEPPLQRIVRGFFDRAASTKIQTSRPAS